MAYSRYWRHNETARAIYMVASNARLNPRLNQPDIVPNFSADLYIPRFHRGFNYVCDITVVNSLATSNLASALRQAITQPLNDAHTRKLTDASGVAFAAVPNTTFQPLVFSALGIPHNSTLTFLKRLASHSSRTSGYAYSSAAQYVYDYIFCALARANAAMMWSRFRRDPLHVDQT